MVPGVGGGEKRRDFFGCFGSPVVPPVSAANSGDVALCLGAPAVGAATCSREPGHGRCWRRRRHLRLLLAAAVASAAGARAPAASAATAAAARAASAAVAASDAPALSRLRGSGRMWVLGIAATFCGLFLLQGKKTKRPAAPPGAHTPSTRPPLRPHGHPPPGPRCAGAAQREFGGGDWCWCPEAVDGKVSKSRAAGREAGAADLRDSSCRCSGCVVRRGSRAGEEGGSERCWGFAEGEGAMKPLTPQVTGRLRQPVGVAPPTGERRAGQPVARALRSWAAALRAQPTWRWEEARGSGACLSGSRGS